MVARVPGPAAISRIGPTVFDRFTGGRDGTLWHYAAVARVLSERGCAVAPKLLEVVVEIEAVVAR